MPLDDLGECVVIGVASETVRVDQATEGVTTLCDEELRNVDNVERARWHTKSAP